RSIVGEVRHARTSLFADVSHRAAVFDLPRAIGNRADAGCHAFLFGRNTGDRTGRFPPASWLWAGLPALFLQVFRPVLPGCSDSNGVRLGRYRRLAALGL